MIATAVLPAGRHSAGDRVLGIAPRPVAALVVAAGVRADRRANARAQRAYWFDRGVCCSPARAT